MHYGTFPTIHMTHVFIEGTMDCCGTCKVPVYVVTGGRPTWTSFVLAVPFPISQYLGKQSSHAMYGVKMHVAG